MGYRQSYRHFGSSSQSLYEPSNWDRYVTGFDWGTDRCLRNAFESHICYSEMLTQAHYVYGWDKNAVYHLIAQSRPLAQKASSSEFWKGVQKDFLNWVKETGYYIQDFPNWKNVLNMMDTSTNNAFNYEKIKKDADNILSNTAKKTGNDLWSMWIDNVPKEYRIIAYVLAGGAVLAYTYPILTVTFRGIGGAVRGVKKVRQRRKAKRIEQKSK